VLILAGRLQVSGLALSNSTICLSISFIKGLLSTSKLVWATRTPLFIHPSNLHLLHNTVHLVTLALWLEMMAVGWTLIIHEVCLFHVQTEAFVVIGAIVVK